MQYIPSADLGATKTHALLMSDSGAALGFGEGRPGNHERVGYEGMSESMRDSMGRALIATGLSRATFAGAAFGVAGYGWASEIKEIQ